MTNRFAIGQRRSWLLVAASVIVSLAVVSGLWLGFGSGGGAAQAQTACETGGATPAGGALARDCEVLLGLQSQLAGTATLNWSADLAIASWDGVHVQSGRVTTVNLINRGLTGTLPARLSELTALVSLALNDNQLTGGIPKEWAQLKALSYLSVTGNRLTGNIPKELGSGPPLWALHLAGNQLSGSIPEELGQSATLRHLTLNGNKLTGSLPANLEGLSTLKVSGNAFTGCLPPVLRKVSSNDLGKLSIKDCATPTPSPTATATPTATVTYALTLSAATGGSLSADPAGESHAAGTVVTVTATAADGYELSSWGDDCASTAPSSTTCALAMDGDRTASATFAKSSAPTTLRYSTYDKTGLAATAGSYAFLTAQGASNQADAARQGTRDSESLSVPIPVTTYEGLRTEADTLRIHVTDGSGVSRASFYGTVEVGDTFEWREAGDCWVRYLVTAVKVGTSPREFAIKPYSYTYTGCTGTVGGSQGDSARDGTESSSTTAVRDFTWKPEYLKTGAFTSPTWHGPWLLIPASWTGPIPQTVLFTPPAITWPPDPIPAPDLGTGWSGGLTPGYPPSELEGWYSHTDGGRLIVYIFQFGRWPFDAYRLAASHSAAGVIHEFWIVNGRYAVVSYDRVKTGISEAQVAIYDDATGLMYSAIGGPLSRNNDPEATINLLQKFILP